MKKYLLSSIIPLLIITSSYAANKKLIEQMTWPEVEAAIQHTKVIVIPIGAAAKEHGTHLPMNTDLIMADYLRDRVLQRMDNVLAAPTITYSYYPAFVEYPGSTTVSFATGKNMIIDISRTLNTQGFKKIYFINTGISTLPMLRDAAKELKKDGINIAYLNLTRFDNTHLNEMTEQKRGTHADEVETSMMLYIAPQTVHMENAKRDDNPERDPENPGGLTRDPHASHGVYSPTGAWGDPTLASKKKGQVITEKLVGYVVKEIQDFIKQS